MNKPTVTLAARELVDVVNKLRRDALEVGGPYADVAGDLGAVLEYILLGRAPAPQRRPGGGQ